MSKIQRLFTGLTEVSFQKSVKMSTYLACFIICNFEYEEKLSDVHKTKFRVYAAPEQRHRVQYPLEVGSNISDFFIDYFNISYPLPKQDMIAIPDFASGGMENWGLITYRCILKLKIFPLKNVFLEKVRFFMMKKNLLHLINKGLLQLFPMSLSTNGLAI